MIENKSIVFADRFIGDDDELQVAIKVGGGMTENAEKGFFKNIMVKANSMYKRWTENEMSLDEKSTAIRRAVYALDTPTQDNYIKNIYEDFIVYECQPGHQSVPGSSAPRKTYKRSYTIDGNGKVVLGDDVMEVKEETVYTPVENVAKRKDVNPEAGEEEYGDVSFADEKNNKYPIDTEAHIRAAWSYINMPKNAMMYSAADLKKMKAMMVAAWKAKISPEGPPSATQNNNPNHSPDNGQFTSGSGGGSAGIKKKMGVTVGKYRIEPDLGSDVAFATGIHTEFRGVWDVWRGKDHTYVKTFPTKDEAVMHAKDLKGLNKNEDSESELNTNEEEEITMVTEERKTKVAALISNGTFTEGDRAFLEGCDCPQFSRIEGLAAKATVNVKAPEQKVVTYEELLANAPQEVKDQHAFVQAQIKANREKLVARIKANTNNKLTDEVLAGMKDDMLQGIADSIAPVANYAGAVGGAQVVNAGAEEVLPLPDHSKKAE